jgi:hypothetical protein
VSTDFNRPSRAVDNAITAIENENRAVAMIQRTYGKFTPKNLFDQVFVNAPEESLVGKGRSQWMERLIEQ